MVAALVVTCVAAWWLRTRNGAVRAPMSETAAAHLPVFAGLGVDPSAADLTVVQFSTAFCAPCRTTKRTLDEVAGMVDGVAHVEIDAESHLDLVRRLKVVRTPTVLVLDADGHVVRRAAGAPRKADVVAALGTFL